MLLYRLTIWIIFFVWINQCDENVTVSTNSVITQTNHMENVFVWINQCDENVTASTNSVNNVIA